MPVGQSSFYHATPSTSRTRLNKLCLNLKKKKKVKARKEPPGKVYKGTMGTWVARLLRRGVRDHEQDHGVGLPVHDHLPRGESSDALGYRSL